MLHTYVVGKTVEDDKQETDPTGCIDQHSLYNDEENRDRCKHGNLATIDGLFTSL